ACSDEPDRVPAPAGPAPEATAASDRPVERAEPERAEAVPHPAPASGPAEADVEPRRAEGEVHPHVAGGGQRGHRPRRPCVVCPHDLVQLPEVVVLEVAGAGLALVGETVVEG